MLFFDIVNSGPTPAMERMLAFTQARHRMLVENIANIDTPGYKARQLNVQEFQEAMREAIDRRNAGSKPLKLGGGREFQENSFGRVEIEPSEEPAENILFHDRTNMRIERQMAMLAENTMMHQIVTDRLKGRFDSLMGAIRGRL